MKVIKLTGVNGSPFYVNPDHITSFYALDDPSTDSAIFIANSSDQGFQVRETPEQIAALCEGVTH